MVSDKSKTGDRWRISEHELVPRHEIIDQEEVITILKEFGVEREKFPKLLSSDPVAKEIEAKVGDVVKVTRKIPSAGASFTYRLVVP